MTVVVFFLAAFVLLGAVALVIERLARRRRLAQPVDRADGLGDDLRLGIGINLWS